MIGRSRWVGYALLSPALLAVGFLILYPLYLVVATSFRQGKTLNVLRLSELPFGVANYRTILASDATWHSVGVTVVYLLGTIGPAFLVGLGAALLLNRAFPGRRSLRCRRSRRACTKRRASMVQHRGSAFATSPGRGYVRPRRWPRY